MRLCLILVAVLFLVSFTAGSAKDEITKELITVKGVTRAITCMFPQLSRLQLLHH
jgi:hypothetical protein